MNAMSMNRLLPVVRRLAASRMLILGLLTLAALVLPHFTGNSAPPARAAASATTPCGVTTTAPSKYKHVIWIWFENKTYGSVIGSSSAPYITSLANKCATNTAEKDAGSQYNSLSNYIAATSGQDSCSGGCSGTGVSTFNDCSPSSSCQAPVDNIFRQVRAVGGTAKSYEETMTSNCQLTGSGNYAPKHNPAAYYVSGSDRTACQSDNLPMGTTSSGNLKNALASDTSLPTFSFITPNLCNDMHDCSVATGDSWLSSWMPLILNSPAYQSGDTAVFVDQDEDTPIPNVVLSPSTPHVVINDSTLSHYSDLRTTEDMLGITTHLGKASSAPALPASYNLLGSGSGGGGGGSDSTPPSSAITSPAAGATVSGTLTVTASATDNVGVTKVELYVDGTLQPNADTSSPYSFSVDTTKLSAGSHSLTVKAYDAAGNVSTSPAVTVNVQQPPSCTVTPDTSLGVVTQTVSIPAAGTYRVWSRIKAPDTTNNSYYLQVDGGCPMNVGDLSSMPANTWTWVNYQNGSTGSVISLSLSAGSHQLVYNGREQGVGLDRLIFTSDTSCVPTGTGDNCVSTSDSTPPTVSLTAPASGSTVSGSSVSLTASASDASGISKVDFLVDGSVVGSSTASPYSVSWNSTAVANGSHTITARATDTAGNTATSGTVTVTVSNTTGGGGGGQPDLTVTNVSWTPASPATGDQVVFNATVKNNGSAATPAGTTVGVAFQVDGTEVTWSDNVTTPLNPGESRTQTANGGKAGTAYWPAAGTTHTVTAWVDDVNRIAESNESNNTLSANLTVGANTGGGGGGGQPDLTVTNVTWTPPSPATGDQVAFSATVKNNGSAATPAGTTVGVAFQVDGTEVTWSDNNSTPLNPGESRTQTANGGKAGTANWQATSGSHTVTAWVDDVNRIAESNESNNQLNASLTVGATTVSAPGDANGDGTVNVTDLSILLSHWQTNYASADFNHDGTVDVFDLSTLLSHYQ